MKITILEYLVKKYSLIIFVVVRILLVFVFGFVLAVHLIVIQQAEPFCILAIIGSNQLVKAVHTTGADSRTCNSTSTAIVTFSHASDNFFVPFFLFEAFLALASSFAGFFISFIIRHIIDNMLEVIFIKFIVIIIIFVIVLLLFLYGETKVFQPSNFFFLLLFSLILNKTLSALLLLLFQHFRFFLEHRLPASVSCPILVFGGFFILLFKFDFPFVVLISKGIGIAPLCSSGFGGSWSGRSAPDADLGGH
mmetsp:Transcript_11334/g.32700  ORF Transcript_11334/g.32700 Transcript_11334/m.32700 type:complete len:250 (-) Transcript_11334:1013-1762(-)